MHVKSLDTRTESINRFVRCRNQILCYRHDCLQIKIDHALARERMPAMRVSNEIHADRPARRATIAKYTRCR